MAASSFATLPEELQGCCAHFLDTTSAGRFGQTSRACWRLVDGQLRAEKAARARAAYDKVSSRWCEELAAMGRLSDGSVLVDISDGGAGLGLFKCACMPDKACRSGTAFSNLARHLASHAHWKHWRLVAFGEEQPMEAEWVAFQATMPPILRVRVRS